MPDPSAIDHLVFGITLTAALVGTVVMMLLSWMGVVKFAHRASRRVLVGLLIAELVVGGVGFSKKWIAIRPSETQQAIEQPLRQKIEEQAREAATTRSRVAKLQEEVRKKEEEVESTKAEEEADSVRRLRELMETLEEAHASEMREKLGPLKETIMKLVRENREMEAAIAGLQKDKADLQEALKAERKGNDE